MRYVRAKLEEVQERDAYRIYVTDSLFCSSHRKSLTKRYVELIDKKKIDTRSGDEIAEEVIRKAGLML